MNLVIISYPLKLYFMLHMHFGFRKQSSVYLSSLCIP